MSDVAVRNASDPRQVKRARRAEERAARRLMENYQTVLKLGEGRELLWTIIRRAGVLRSVLNQSGSLVYYNAGKQDFGLSIMADIQDADPDGYLLMEREARDRARKEATEREAHNTPRADEGDDKEITDGRSNSDAEN